MQTRKVDIVVIGIGIAGLSFARTMQQHGREVLILERSRAVGGRCATWRHADLAMDYGVPFLHARSPLFWQAVDQLLGADVLSGWPQRVQGNGPTCQPRALDPGVRHAALRGGLNTLAKKLAAANAESLRLLKDSDFGPATAGAMALFGLTPTLPTLSLLACYETPPSQPDWELLLPETSASIQLISNESSKNTAGQKLGLCIQAQPAWSRQRLDSASRLRLGIGRITVPAAENWFVRLPFSIYLGWITVATVANVTSLPDYLKWDGLGIAPEIWMGIVLAAVLVIAALMNFTRRDIAYTAAILWALVGISVKHAAVPAVALPTWITFGLVALTLAAAFFLRRTEKTVR